MYLIDLKQLSGDQLSGANESIAYNVEKDLEYHNSNYFFSFTLFIEKEKDL